LFFLQTDYCSFRAHFLLIFLLLLIFSAVVVYETARFSDYARRRPLSPSLHLTTNPIYRPACRSDYQIVLLFLPAPALPIPSPRKISAIDCDVSILSAPPGPWSAFSPCHCPSHWITFSLFQSSRPLDFSNSATAPSSCVFSVNAHCFQSMAFEVLLNLCFLSLPSPAATQTPHDVDRIMDIVPSPMFR